MLGGFKRLFATEHIQPFVSFSVGLGNGHFSPLKDMTLYTRALCNFISAAVASDKQFVDLNT